MAEQKWDTILQGPKPDYAQGYLSNKFANDYGNDSVLGSMPNKIQPLQQQPIQQPIQQQPVQQPQNNNVWVRDYLNQKGLYNVGWDDANKQVLINGQSMPISGLSVQDGKSYATPSAIDAAYKATAQNSVQNGQFVSQWTPERNQLIQQAQDKVNQGYQAPIGNDQMVDLFNNMLRENNVQYDPNTDPALANAQQQAMTAVQNRFAASGMLYGDTSKAIMAQEASNLVGEYTKQFYMNQQNKINNMLRIGEFGRNINADEYIRYTDSIKNIMNIEDMYSKFDEKDFNIFKENIQILKDQADQTLQEQKFQLDQNKELYSRARDRVEDLGYVDNEASIILGLPVGTLSKAARERLNKMEDFIQQEGIKYKYDVAKTQNSYDLALRNTLQAEATRFSNDMKQMNAQEAKEKRVIDYKEKNSSSGSTKSAQKDIDYQTILNKIETNPDIVLEELQQNMEDYVTYFSQPKYNQLINAAKKSYSAKIKGPKYVSPNSED